MIETYDLPILFSEEERRRYAQWGIKREKFATPLMVLVLVLDLVLVVGTLLYLIGFLKQMPGLFLFLTRQTPFFTLVGNALFVVVSLFVYKPLELLFDLLHGRPDDPRTLRLVPRPRGMNYQLLLKKKELARGSIPWNEWDRFVKAKENQILIEGEWLTIGANTRENIYPKNQQRPWLEVPGEKIVTPIELGRIRRNMDGYLASLEEKEKEKAWAEQNAPRP